MNTKQIESIDDFKRMAVSDDGVSFISPLGMLVVYMESGKWLVEDTACAPDPVLDEYDSLDSLLANFKRDGKRIEDVLRDVEVLLD